MRLLTDAVLLYKVLFASCATQADIPNGLTSESDTFAPAAYKDGREVEPQQYRTDRDLCLKPVPSQTDMAMTEATNISKFRECLIGKGYLLLG